MTAWACHPDLRLLAEAAEVRSPTRFAVCGQERDLAALAPSGPSGWSGASGAADETAGGVPAGEEPAVEALLRALEGELYHRLYCRSPAAAPPSEPDAAEALAFVSALSAANGGSGTWEPDWHVAWVEPDGRIAVRRDGVVFWAAPDDVRADAGAAAGTAAGTAAGGEAGTVAGGAAGTVAGTAAGPAARTAAGTAARTEAGPVTRTVARTATDTAAGTAAGGDVGPVMGTLAPGQACRVRVAKELRRLLPGFYTALGDAPEPAGPPVEGPRLRLYWHLTAASAAAYLRTATATLNAARVPFRTKVLADPRRYVRADAGVLYLRRADLDRAHASVRAIHHALQADLRPAVPLFTLRLAQGLGLAEDPGDGASFGQSRCRLAAGALWAAYTRGHSGAEQRLGDLIEAFGASGCDPERPYLQAGPWEPCSLDF